MKKIFATCLSLILVLSACGSSEETQTGNSDEPYFYNYRTAEFSMDVPDTWELINAFDSTYPEEVRAIFRNNLRDLSFVANVSVIREENTKNLSNFDFAQNKLAEHANTLINYRLISQEEIVLDVPGGESQTLLTHFEGQNELTGPKLLFEQIYLVSGDETWTTTASYSPNEDEFVLERMNTMLRSFTLR